MSDNSGNFHYDGEHCTLSYIRVLTRPFIFPPHTIDELKDILTSNQWNIPSSEQQRIPVDSNDDITRIHWEEQNKNSKLFQSMFQWVDTSTNNNDQQHHSRNTIVLHPYFNFGKQKNNMFFFQPWKDIGNNLKHLLLNQIGCYQTGTYMVLISHDTPLFISTSSSFMENDIGKLYHASKYCCNKVYNLLLRCHHDQRNRQLIFGYHHPQIQNQNNKNAFNPLYTISLNDEDWRLKTCIVLTNIARIINSLKDYGIPLTCNDKLSLVLVQQKNNEYYDYCIQKIYHSNNICEIFHTSTVTNMISIYKEIQHIPYTDKLVSVVVENNQQQEQSSSPSVSYTCQFAPIGRTYLPENINELLDALVCVSTALVELHKLNIMHRDIRWANVFHAFKNNHNNNSRTPTNNLMRCEDPNNCSYDNEMDNDYHHDKENVHTITAPFTNMDALTMNQHQIFSREWLLFDFEYAAKSPQPPFGAHTLTPGNHAPEMMQHGIDSSSTDNDKQEPHKNHTTAVDIWGLGYLILTCKVDIPSKSYYDVLYELKENCMKDNPNERPTAMDCLHILSMLRDNINESSSSTNTSNTTNTTNTANPTIALSSLSKTNEYANETIVF